MRRLFPATRMRRLRQTNWSRRLVTENMLSVNDLIWPIFITEGENQTEPVASMPGVARLSIDLAVDAAKQAAALGIPVIALFPNTPDAARSDNGEEAL
ncbi:MAG: porphobilinogen synthase, partial [Alphaproteobacteria bacterium]|nr:porphobilinogen synthase [Alphaproteobacteria bacterium]